MPRLIVESEESESEASSDSEPELDPVSEALEEVVDSIKVQLLTKPTPVRTYLSTSYYQMLKASGGDLQCCICLEKIDCPNCFELWSCGHFIHRHCSAQLRKPRCPQCN